MVRGERMFTAHVDRVGRIAADGLGMTGDEFAEHAGATPERLLFTVNALQAATRTAWEAKLQALGRVLRDGLSDDALLDEMPLVLAALDAIEAPHVRGAAPSSPPTRRRSYGPWRNLLNTSHSSARVSSRSSQRSTGTDARSQLAPIGV
jgi:hypothetical protein